MTRTALILATLAAVLLPGGCNTAATTEEEILIGTADTAVFMGDFADIVFWEIPKFIVWTTPKAILYDLPRAGILAISGTSATVESLVEQLRLPDLPDEEVLRITRELRDATGIPLRSREAWLGWWRDNRTVPDGQWRAVFADRQVGLLVSPDYFQRSVAFDHLQEMYGTTLDYDPKQGPKALSEGAARWRARVEDQ